MTVLGSFEAGIADFQDLAESEQKKIFGNFQTFLRTSAVNLAVINRDPNFKLEVDKDASTLTIAGTKFDLLNPSDVQFAQALLRIRYESNKLLDIGTLAGNEQERLRVLMEQEAQILDLKNQAGQIVLDSQMAKLYSPEELAEAARLYVASQKLGSISVGDMGDGESSPSFLRSQIEQDFGIEIRTFEEVSANPGAVILYRLLKKTDYPTKWNEESLKLLSSVLVTLPEDFYRGRRIILGPDKLCGRQLTEDHQYPVIVSYDSFRAEVPRDGARILVHDLPIQRL